MGSRRMGSRIWPIRILPIQGLARGLEDRADRTGLDQARPGLQQPAIFSLPGSNVSLDALCHPSRGLDISLVSLGLSLVGVDLLQEVLDLLKVPAHLLGPTVSLGYGSGGQADPFPSFQNM